MEFRDYVACDELLGIRTNVDIAKLKWSFGVTIPPASKQAFDGCRIRLNLAVTRSAGIRNELADSSGELGKYHYWRGAPRKDRLYYQRDLFFGRQLYLRAESFLSNAPSLEANDDYYRFVVGRFINLHSLGYMATDLACLLLLRNGYVPLHCSAFKKGDATVLIFAPANTGKTLTTMLACMKHGAQFIAEDIAISDGHDIFALPWTSTFRYYSDVDQTLRSRILNRLIALIPPVALMSLDHFEPITTYVDPAKIAPRSTITHVVILERGPTAVENASEDEFLRKALNINRYEFSYFKSPILTAYEFFNPSLGIEASTTAEKTLLQQIVTSAKKRLFVRTEDASQYVSLILDEI